MCLAPYILGTTQLPQCTYCKCHKKYSPRELYLGFSIELIRKLRAFRDIKKKLKAEISTLPQSFSKIKIIHFVDIFFNSHEISKKFYLHSRENLSDYVMRKHATLLQQVTMKKGKNLRKK